MSLSQCIKRRHLTQKFFEFHEGVKKCHFGNFSERAGMAGPCSFGPRFKIIRAQPLMDLHLIFGKLIELFDTILSLKLKEWKNTLYVVCTCLTVRKKEKSRQVLAHKRGRKWQIDGHHVEYDVLQPSQMMDVLNSAQWSEIFQFASIFLFAGWYVFYTTE